MCIFTTPLEASQRLGELLVQGRVPAGAALQYLKGKALRSWCCGTRQGTGTGAFRPPPATGLKHVAALGPVCSRLCVPGKSTCTEHPVREPSSAVRRLAGRLLRAAAHLSPFLSEFLKEALWWGQSLWRGCFSGSRDVPVCPGLFALQPKGQLSRKIAQTTHLRLASLRLVPQSFLIVSTNQR